MALGFDYSLGFGGFDHEFVGELGDDFVCHICSKVLRDPQLTLCCGQHYCKSCIEHWAEKQGQSSCPHCRQTDFSHVSDKSIERKVKALGVFCVHCDDGCEWSGELGDLEAHLDYGNGCGYVEVTCSNMCGAALRRKDSQNHRLNECLLRQYRCEHCGMEDKYGIIITQHYSECTEYPVPCPKGCSMDVKRSSLENHVNECPLEEVDCPYSEAGCTAPLLRKDLEDHLVQSAHQHLRLFLPAFLQVKTRVDSLGGSVDEVKAQLAITERQLQDQLRKSEEKFQREMKELWKWIYVLVAVVAFLLALTITVSATK